MDLSRERLEAVERYLHAGGFSGKLNLIPKGKSEPFTGVDRTKYAGEALYQLDRRVELRLLR
jgi:outer membrane protein OmpA-like peptidoglycan-associated protein